MTITKKKLLKKIAAGMTIASYETKDGQTRVPAIVSPYYAPGFFSVSEFSLEGCIIVEDGNTVKVNPRGARPFTLEFNA